MHGRRGYTLVEILTVILIVFVALVGLIYVLSEAGRNTWLLSDAQLESETDAQRALDRMAEDLRVARSAQIRCLNAGAGPLEIGPDGGPNEIRYTYDAGADTLTKTIDGANPAVAGTKLTAFTCTPPNASRVVTLTVTSQGGRPSGRTDTQTLSTNVWVQLP